MKVRRSIWISAALVIAVAVILVVMINAQNKAITFKDPNFEAMLRAQIGKPSGDIHEADIENIKVFSFDSNISGKTTDYGAVKGPKRPEAFHWIGSTDDYKRRNQRPFSSCQP